MADYDIFRDEDRHQNPIFNPVFHNKNTTPLKTPLVNGQYWYNPTAQGSFDRVETQLSTGTNWLVSTYNKFTEPFMAEVIDSVGGQDINTNAGQLKEWDLNGTLFETSHYSKPDINTIRVLNSGIYEINFSISSEIADNIRKNPMVELRINGDSLLKSRCYAFTRNSNNKYGTIQASGLLVQLSANDNLTLFSQRFGDAGSMLTLAGESYWNIKLIRLI